MNEIHGLELLRQPTLLVWTIGQTRLTVVTGPGIVVDQIVVENGCQCLQRGQELMHGSRGTVLTGLETLHGCSELFEQSVFPDGTESGVDNVAGHTWDFGQKSVESRDPLTQFLVLLWVTEQLKMPRVDSVHDSQVFLGWDGSQKKPLYLGVSGRGVQVLGQDKLEEERLFPKDKRLPAFNGPAVGEDSVDVACEEPAQTRYVLPKESLIEGGSAAMKLN